MTPYYADELVTLYHGDCEEVLPHVPPADLIFTSPPYNMQVTTGGGFGHYSDGSRWNSRGGGGKWTGGALAEGYDGHDDGLPLPEYEDWQRRVLKLCWDALSDTGAIFYNHKPRPQRTLWLPLRVNPDLPLRQIITWVRAGGVNFTQTHYLPTYEWIMVLAKDGWRIKSRGAAGVSDVWRVAQESGTEHPAPFPVGLPLRAIESAAPSLVIDPFVGSGTTLVAAKRLGVKAIGIDKSERYCEMAVRRLAQGALDFGEAS